jgi:hypothetical protein
MHMNIKEQRVHTVYDCFSGLKAGPDVKTRFQQQQPLHDDAQQLSPQLDCEVMLGPSFLPHVAGQKYG